MLARLARFCYRRRKFVIPAWILILVFAFIASGAFKGEWETSGGGLAGTDSQQAFDLLKSEFPAQAGEDSAFVFGDTGKDPVAIATFLEKAAAVDGVGSVEQPPRVSPDGRVGTVVLHPAHRWW